MSFEQIRNPDAAKLAALRAAREVAKQLPEAALTKYVSASEAKERLRVIFDDSASMSGEIENAKEGTVELLRNCIPNQTAVAIDFLNTVHEELGTFNTNLPQVSQTLKGLALQSGGTPLYTTMLRSLKATPVLTRLIVFTDGQPTDNLVNWDASSELDSRWHNMKRNADEVIKVALELHVPIDTVFFGDESDQEAIRLLKYFAEQTGGYFLHFDPKKVNFRTAFKYLAPSMRLMLASESVRKEIESGKRA